MKKHNECTGLSCQAVDKVVAHQREGFGMAIMVMNTSYFSIASANRGFWLCGHGEAESKDAVDFNTWKQWLWHFAPIFMKIVLG